MNASTGDEDRGEEMAQEKSEIGLLPVGRVSLLELLQDADLYLACITVLWYRPDDLHCNSFTCHGVNSLDDFPKSSLSKQPDRTI